MSSSSGASALYQSLRLEPDPRCSLLCVEYTASERSCSHPSSVTAVARSSILLSLTSIARGLGGSLYVGMSLCPLVVLSAFAMSRIARVPMLTGFDV